MLGVSWLRIETGCCISSCRCCSSCTCTCADEDPLSGELDHGLVYDRVRGSLKFVVDTSCGLWVLLGQWVRSALGCFCRCPCTFADEDVLGGELDHGLVYDRVRVFLEFEAGADSWLWAMLGQWVIGAFGCFCRFGGGCARLLVLDDE